MSEWFPSALKDRPRRWEQVFDQPVAVRFLKNSISFDRIAPCYIFHGPTGVGKTSVARLFAAAINCIASDKPCGTCSTCIGVYEGISDYVIEQDAAGERGVEMVDGIKERLNIKLPPDKKLIVVFDECHAMSPGAWNSLLKTLEEPPPSVVFILVTTNVLKLPATVRSRVMDVRFKAVSDTVIANVVEHIFVSYGLTAWAGVPEMIAKQVAHGSVREAQHTADLLVLIAADGVISYEDAANTLGVASVEVSRVIANAMLDKDVAIWLRTVDGLIGKGLPANAILSAAHRVIRDMVVAVSTHGAMEDFSGLSIEKLRPHITLHRKELDRLEDCVIEAIEQSGHADARLSLEMLYAKFIFDDPAVAHEQ